MVRHGHVHVSVSRCGCNFGLLCMDQIIATFGIDWKILIVQIVNFSVLFAALSYLLYKPLLRLIEQRRTQIIESIANAERAENALKDADAKKIEIVTKASLEADGMLTAARDAAKAKEAAILTEARQRYERILAEGVLKSDELKREALEESREELARLIVLGIEKTLMKRSEQETA